MLALHGSFDGSSFAVVAEQSVVGGNIAKREHAVFNIYLWTKFLFRRLAKKTPCERSVKLRVFIHAYN